MSNKDNAPTIDSLPDDFFRWFFNKHDFLPAFSPRTKKKRVYNMFPHGWASNVSTLEVDIPHRCVSDLETDTCYDIIHFLEEVTGIKPISNSSKYAEMELYLQEQYWAFKEYQRRIYEEAAFQVADRRKVWRKKVTQGDQEFYKDATDFNIIFHREIQMFNADAGQWERHFEVSLEYRREDGRIVPTNKFVLEPGHTVTSSEFQKAVWQVAFCRVYMNDYEVRDFFKHLHQYYLPPQVYQYDHYGFIDFQGRRYYLARNVLVSIPQNDTEQLLLIAPDAHNCFAVEDDVFIQLDPNVEPAPRFELEEPDELTGMYERDMKQLYPKDQKATFQGDLEVIREKMNEMLAGQLPAEQQYEGSLLLAYVFSYLFFEDIFESFGHIIFAYLYGKANTGKGKMAEVLLSFFGISGSDKQINPTKAALENSLAMHSKVPCWIDEFVPDDGSGKSKIPDQLFNTFFELGTRQISSSANRRQNAFKVTRSMILFTSNYRPQTDHLNSRLIKIQSASDKRGPEASYYWLAERKKKLQLLFISSMQWYHDFDRKLYRELLRDYKSDLKTRVKEKLAEEREKTGVEFNVEDRQLQQIGALLTTNLFLYAGDHYRELHQLERTAKNSDPNTQEMLQNYRNQGGLFDFSVTFVAENAQQVSASDPLTDFLDTIGYMVEEGKIGEFDYHWQGNHLKVSWNRVWEAYEKHKMHNAVPKEVVRHGLASRAKNASTETLSWVIIDPSKVDGKRKYHTRGFYLKDIAQDKRFKFAFNHPELRHGVTPGGETSNNQ